MTSGLDRVNAWRGQTESARRQDLLRDLQQLEVKARGIERDTRQLVGARRLDAGGGGELATLLELETSLREERHAGRRRLHEAVERVRAAVVAFKTEFTASAMAKQPNGGADFVVRARAAVEAIERLVLELKEDQRAKFDELTAEERVLAQEIAALDKRIDAWKLEETTATAAASAAAASSARAAGGPADIAEDLPPEVAAFERFLGQTGGHSGGWDDVDHRAFLRARQRHAGRPVFVDEALAHLPTKTAQQVRQHEMWYAEYSGLLHNKKTAIAKWRQQKAAETAAAAAAAEAEDPDSEEEAERRRAERLRSRVDAERRERAAELGAWRSAKETEAQREAAERQRRLAEEASKKADAERRKQAELRRQADEFRARREAERAEAAEEEARREAEERAQRRLQTEADAGRLRERNRQIVEERLARRQQLAEQEEEKQRRLAQLKACVEVRAVRDPDRLLKPTAGWRERLAAAAEEKPAGGSVGPAAIPHRAVPSWRQGLH